MSNPAVAIKPAYPALTEMGIARFHEISHYNLVCEGKNKDILRISYDRKKGSFLAKSRKYEFGRSLKTVIADGGTARMEQTYEISPFLLTAVSELDALIALRQNHNAAEGDAKRKHKTTVAVSSSDMETLQAWVTEKLGAEHAVEVAERFAALKA
ncbi:MAG: DUF3461 family protein [Granulosicoccus sp.]